MKRNQGCTMSLVPLMLTSKAAAWHSRTARSSLQAAGEAPVHWPAFRDLIERRFGIPYREQDARDRFDNLQRAAVRRTLGPQWISFFLTWARGGARPGPPVPAQAHRDGPLRAGAG